MWFIILVKILHDFLVSYFIKYKSQDDYRPPKYAWLSYAQTFLIFCMYGFKNMKYIASDVLNPEEPIFLEWMSLPSDNSPIIILMHGIGGCSDSCYIRAWFKNTFNYGIVVLNRPGYHSKHPLPTCCKTYPTFCDPHILEKTVDYLVSKYSKNPIYIVGYSGGGVHTFKYAASSRRHSNVKGVIGVSVCYEMIHMLDYLEKARWMNQFMGILMMDMFNNNPKVFPLLQKYKRGGLVTEIIKDFLLYYLNTGESIDSYLLRCSCHEEMKNPDLLNIPSLCIQSRDDMFFPTAKIETLLDEIKIKNKHVKTIITDYGGHVSWVDENHEIWVIKCIRDFIDQNNYFLT